MNEECYTCHIRTINKLINKFKPDRETSESFYIEIKKILAENKKQTNPYLSTLIHRLAKSKLNSEDLYAEEKKSANKLLLNRYKYWKSLIDESNNPFYMAAKLAVTGNIIDYGAHSAPDDIESHIHKLIKNPFKINKTTHLFKQIRLAKSILYLGDNAGEIVFDKLFIETMEHPDVTYVVKNKPVINDVTLQDAAQTGMDRICQVITNGYDAPSTLPEYCSDEFLKEYNNADLIISKGQGNFEGLMNEKNKNLFFMLIAKCNPMAELLNVKKGDMIVTDLNKN